MHLIRFTAHKSTIFIARLYEIPNFLFFSVLFSQEIRNLRAKSIFMEPLTITDMTDMLTEIYDCRLKALIGYTNTAFTREIVVYMFKHFMYINKHTSHGGYKFIQIQHFSDILSFQPGAGSQSGDGAGYSALQLILKLENYILRNVELLYPNWRDTYDDDEYRRVLGDAFQKEVEKHPERYPEHLSSGKFFSQLSYTTKYRNKLAHNQEYGNSGMYRRYYILQAYDAILTYLLYTFYYMCLNEDYELKYIKE